MDDLQPKTGGSGSRKAVITALLVLVIGFGILGKFSDALAQFAVRIQEGPVGSADLFSVNWNTQKPNLQIPLRDALIQGTVTASIGAIDYFFAQLAYATAVSLTSECPGQKVCWDSKAFSDGLTQAWQGAVGNAIANFGESFGVNLCNPGPFGLQIKIGLLAELKPPPPKCDFNAIANNWKTLANTLTTPKALFQLSAQFNGGGQAPVAYALEAIDRASTQTERNSQREFVTKSLRDAAGGGGFSPLSNPISGRVLSPSESVKQEFQQANAEHKRAPKDAKLQYNAGQIASQAAVGVAINTVRTFVQTIIARLFNKFIQGLLSSEDLIALQPDIFLNEEGQVQVGSSPEIVATKFFSPPPLDSGVIDPLEQFTICPGQNRTKDNCVIDNQFATAVRVSEGTPLTVADALKNGLLHGEWPLISAIDKAKDQDPFCFTTSYCESNLKKLRASRIIPIGWEIAARKSPVQNPVKLKDVAAKFNDCNDQGLGDLNHPYCHLVDPNWLLKAPPAQCRAQVHGAQLFAPDLPERAHYCADQPTCLKTDDFGTCIGGWGYCAREKNIWRFQGDSCPAEYNSCRRLTQRGGNGQQNYLLNTVDAGICNADNVGCQSYSLVKNAVTCALGSSNVCSSPNGCPCNMQLGSCAVPNGKLTCGLPNGNRCALDSTCAQASGCTCNGAICTVRNGSKSCILADGDTCERTNVCNSAAGCQCTKTHSCTVKNGERSCLTIDGVQADKADDWYSTPARYFNAKVSKCSASDAGCTAITPLSQGESLNLVKNGGFEQLEDGDGDGLTDHPSSWIPFAKVPAGGNGAVAEDPTRATSGTRSILLSSGSTTQTCSLGSCSLDQGCPCLSGDYSCKVPKGETTCVVTNRLIQDGLPVIPKKTYTLSASFKGQPGSTATMSLSFVDARGKAVNLFAGQLSAANSFTTDITGSCDLSAGTIALQASSTEAAFRPVCTFAIDNGAVAHATLEISGANLAVDNVQLEEGGGSAFHEGYGAATSSVNAKVPPAYLRCKGEPTDRPECGRFAGVCRENEVGCDSFTPTNGDASVPGIVGPQDACPRECVGYDIYKQDASDFDTDKFPVYFIPSTARQCSGADAGCSEFTNLDAEKREFYSKLRLCQKPDAADSTTYYSWEGSDTVGFQLKVWNLKASDQTTTSCSAADQSICSDFAASGAAGTASGIAPCTKLSATDKNRCDDADSASFCSRADIVAGNFDCREFYDVDGNRHFRLLTNTIVVTPDCHPYRITVSTQADCSRGDGTWDVTRNECVYVVSAADSKSCSAQANGCRAYKGGAADNVRTVVTDGFEEGLTDWRDKSGQISGIELSSESVTVGGHSLKIKQRDGGNAAVLDVSAITRPGRVYSLSFWARGAGKLVVGFADGGDVQCTFDCKLASGMCTDSNGCACTRTDGKTCTIASGRTSCDAACKQDDGCTCIAPDNLACSVAKDANSCTVRTSDPPTVVTQAGSGLTLPLFADQAPATCSLGSSCGDSNGCLCTTTEGLQCTVGRSENSCTVPTPVVDLTGDWKQYVVGPVTVRDPRWGNSRVDFRIATDGTQDAYFDTLDMKVAADRFFVVRDSWRTPVSCDRTLEGAPSPLEMLGCREYHDSKSQTRYLKSFSTLCREQAVGCQAYSVSQNSPEPYEQTFNAVCTLPQTCTSTDACPCDYKLPNPARPQNPTVLGDVCRVRRGSNECRFKLDGRFEFSGFCAGGTNAGNSCLKPGDCPSGSCTAADAATHQDVAVVPADERRYLVVRQKDFCDASALGCVETGQQHLAFDGKCALPKTCALRDPANPASDAGTPCTADAECNSGSCAAGCNPGTGDICSCTDAPSGQSCNVKKGETSCTFAFEDGKVDMWKTVAVKDDASKYEQTLCTQPELACEEYSATDGKFYFKDPGDKTCRFKETAVQHICQGGSDAGKQCVSQKVCQDPQSYSFGKACLLDADCGTGVCAFKDCAGGTCAAVTRSGWFRKSASGAEVACYPELVRDGDFFNIYRNSDGSCTLPSSCSVVGGCPCPATGAATCRVSKGNTSCGYDGWVGECESRFDRCEEFIDPLDTSGTSPQGEPYYYIVNTKVDLSSCNSTASLKQGCVLFTRTSDTRRLYNAAATYFVSDKDALGAKVSPLNCNGSSRNSRCEKRCFGISNGRCSLDNNPCIKDQDCPRVLNPVLELRLAFPTVAQRCAGDFYHSYGCQKDNDCNVAVGEVCDDGTRSGQLNATFTGNDSNVVIKVKPDRSCGQWLSCEASASVWDNQKNKWTSQCIGFGLCDKNEKSGEAFECVDWLTPPKRRLTERTYVSRDTKYFGLDYSGFSVREQYPPQYVTPVRALAPGYCLESSSSKVVAYPLRSCSTDSSCDFGACIAGKCADDQRRNCISGADCGQGQVCSVENGTNTLTGICAGDVQLAGTPCKPPAADAKVVPHDCGFGYCLNLTNPNSINALRYGIPINHCGSDTTKFCDVPTDCPFVTRQNPSDPQQTISLPDTCVGDCTSDADCPDDSRGHGSCLGEPGSFRCMYDISGGPLVVTNPETQASCRAYPEKDAPFDNGIIDTQKGQHAVCPDEPKFCVKSQLPCVRDSDCRNDSCEGLTRTSPPNGFDCSGAGTAKKSGFNGSNVCVLGNDCDCSYSKFSYGSYNRYMGYSLPPSDPMNPGRAYDASSGACIGGPLEGRECKPECELFCRNQGVGPDGKPTDISPPLGCPKCPYDICGGTTGAGTCTPLKELSSALGWNGFCLDRDRSTNVNASPSQFACNLWLPIDQLPGAQDIYNQAKQAGFQPPTQGAIAYCQIASGNKKTLSGFDPLGGAVDRKAYEVILHDDLSSSIGVCLSKDATEDGCAKVNSEFSDAAKRRTECLEKMNTMRSGAKTRACAFKGGVCVDRIQTCDPGPEEDQALIVDSNGTGDACKTYDTTHQKIGDRACAEAGWGAPFEQFCESTTCTVRQPSDSAFASRWFKYCSSVFQICDGDPTLANLGRVQSISQSDMEVSAIPLYLRQIAGIKVEFVDNPLEAGGDTATVGSSVVGSGPPPDVDTNYGYSVSNSSDPQKFPFFYVYPSDGGTGTDAGDPGHNLGTYPFPGESTESVIYANSLRWHGNGPGIGRADHGRQYTSDRDSGAIVGEGAKPATLPGGESDLSDSGSCAGILLTYDPNDPSKADEFCDHWLANKDGGDNCLALGFRFSKTDGRLLGALAGACNSARSADVGHFWVAGVRVTAKLREDCTDVAVTYDGIHDKEQNMVAPQTNRLMNEKLTEMRLSGSNYTISKRPSSGRCVDNVGGTDLSPYGRLGMCDKPAIPSPSLTTFPAPAGTAYDGLGPLPFPVFFSEYGSPYTRIASKAPSDISGECSGGNDPPPLPLRRPVYTYNTACEESGGNGYTLSIFQQYYRIQEGKDIGGYPFACLGSCGSVDVPNVGTIDYRVGDGANARTAGVGNVARLFAQALGVFTWSDTQNKYVVRAGTCANNTSIACDNDQDCGSGTCTRGSNNWDQRVSLTDQSQTPQVHAVDIFTCDASGQCPESSGSGITVNGTSSGQVFGSNGRLKAAIQYYAHADKDHMPIRRKTIDFGDDTPLSPIGGYYKNRRGSEISAQAGTARLGCDSGEWGRTQDSCEPRYFEEIKTYLCSSLYASSLQACGTGVYPCNRDGACVFKPRVQIMDNWRICNGVCNAGSDNKDICINKGNGVLHDYECNTFNTPYGTGPWTEFAGEIVVQP